MAVRSTQSRNRAARSTQEGVTRMVMDCGTCIIFIRFRIPDQVYCNKTQNNNIFFFKYPPPFYTDLGLSCTLLSCECKSSFFKEDRCKCE